jgi:cell division protease FtsH
MALVEEAEARAREIIIANRAALEKLANYLQEKEVISREEMLALIGSDTSKPIKKPA